MKNIYMFDKAQTDFAEKRRNENILLNVCVCGMEWNGMEGGVRIVKSRILPNNMSKMYIHTHTHTLSFL